MCVWTMQICSTGEKKGGHSTLMEIAKHSLKIEKRQIAISSSPERDKCTFPKYTPYSESEPCKGETIADQPPFWV